MNRIVVLGDVVLVERDIQMIAARPDILRMSRNQARSDEMAKAVFQKAKALGVGPNLEGQGLVNL